MPCCPRRAWRAWIWAPRCRQRCLGVRRCQQEMESGSAGPDPVPALPPSPPPTLFPCRAGTEAGGGSRRCRRGVELPTFLIPDSHSLLDLGSGMSWGRREHHAALGKPPDSPNKTCRGSSPPCEAAQASSPPNASSRGWEAAVPSFLGRDAAGWKGCRAPPARLQTPTQPRGPHAALGDTGLGVLPGPSQG